MPSTAADTALQRKLYPAKLKEQKERSRVKRKYGITLETYRELLDKGCAICGRTDGRMNLDHCHETGKVRAALCAGCNWGLGKFGDDLGRVEAAAAYLRRHA